MPSNITRIDDSAKAGRPQGVAAKRKFSSQDIVIESVRDRIANRWAEGALELSLSIEYRVRRAFVEAVLRHEFRKMREELRALRRESRRAA